MLSVPFRLARRSIGSAARRVPLAFAFDIDGVLIRGPEVIPAAQRALRFLDGHNPLRAKIPFIQITNGGGELESVKVQKLSKQLDFPIYEEQFVQSHTVLRKLVAEYSNKPVLVLGGKGDTGRRIAQHYGFKDVYIPLDVLAWQPSVWPLGAEFISPSDLNIARRADFSRTPIEAVFVLHDPRPSWFLEIQVVTDILRSQYLTAAAPPPKLVFCNPDLLWRGQFPKSRLGQGGFREALMGVYRALEGKEYPYKMFGKPTRETYDFAKNLLRAQLGSDLTHTRIYMVGDNPESDIAGANAAGWHSALVRTGVYDPAHGKPAHEPTFEAEDVDEAVLEAFKRECGPEPRTP
ncbi:HAD hydrolase [Auricularia subglabra TFB-10046 SS5]|uniref:HAD hydrolase n=1 Tax=Auricularia subglabra (strain TFB-10046 / SS5) TaxID=717982 RepID=J0D8J9_AURST|nr:HAD hydrolase [Auricularia subglabra TFB-10046 SS5]